MDRRSYKLFFTIILFEAISTNALAAKPVNLRHQPPSLQTPTFQQQNVGEFSLQQTKVMVDFKKTTHIRAKQYYAGYPVWGGDAVFHIATGHRQTIPPALNMLLAVKDKNVQMNGTIYRDLAVDLQNTQALVFTAVHAEKAVQHAVKLYQAESGTATIKQTKNQLMVYVDKQNIAHWVFLVSLLAESGNKTHAEPIYIMDAMTFEVYKKWNNFKTLELVQAGGYGGNDNDLWVYDDTRALGNRENQFAHHRPAFMISRDNVTNLCYMKNEIVKVLDNSKENNVSQFQCAKPDKRHNHIYWNQTFDQVNGGFSPSNDLLANALVVKKIYEAFGAPLLLDSKGNPMKLELIAHSQNMGANAGWSDFTLNAEFGDGDRANLISPRFCRHTYATFLH